MSEGGKREEGRGRGRGWEASFAHALRAPPPLACPSSLVTITEATSTFSLKALACDSHAWPIVPINTLLFHLYVPAHIGIDLPSNTNMILSGLWCGTKRENSLAELESICLTCLGSNPTRSSSKITVLGVPVFVSRVYNIHVYLHMHHPARQIFSREN